MKYLLFPLLLFSAFKAISQTGTAADLQKLAAMDTSARIGKLPNGLTYYIKPYDGADKTCLFLVVKVGSYFESKNEYEFAHLTEHMAFEGTLHFPGDSLINYFEKKGMGFGNEISAATRPTYTQYYLDIPSDDHGLYRNGLLLLKDWIGNISMEPRRVTAQRGAVVGEMRRGGLLTAFNEYGQLNAAIAMAIGNNPAYSIDRSKQAVENLRANFSYPAFTAFYKRWYRPDRAAVIIVGDIDVSEVETDIRSMFSDIPKPADAIDSGDPEAGWEGSLTGKNKTLAFTHKKLSEIDIKIYLKRNQDLPKSNSPEAYLVPIADRVFNIMMNQRILKVQHEYLSPFRNPVMHIDRNLFHFPSDVGALVTEAKVDDPAILETAFKRIITELKRVKKYGFTSNELMDAKKQTEAEIKSEPATSFILAERNRDHFINDKRVPAPENYRKLRLQLLNNVTLVQMDDFAKHWINFDSDRDVVVTAPDEARAELPDEKIIEKWIQTAEAEQADVPGDHPPIERLIPDNLQSLQTERSKFKEERIFGGKGVKMVLKNGATIILYPSKSRRNSVDFLGYSYGGSSLYPDSLALTAKNVASIAFNGGAGKFDRFQLSGYLAKKNVKVNPYIDETSEQINGRCPTNELETMLQAVYLYFTEPKIDQVTVDDWKLNKIADINRNMKVTFYMFDQAIKMAMDKEKQLTKQDVQQVTARNASEIYRQRFAGGADFNFFIAGDFAISTIKPTIIKYLGALPKGGQTERKVAPKPYNAERLNRTIYAGVDGKAEVCLFFPGAREYEYNDKNNLILDLLGMALQHRVFDRMRTTEGGAYSPLGFVTYKRLSRTKGTYRFGISFECDSGNTDNMITFALEELRALKEKGVDPDLFAKIYAEAEDKVKRHIKYGVTATILMDTYLNHENLDKFYSKEEVLKSITVQELNKAASTYLSDGNVQTFTVMPESFRAGK